MLMTFFLDDEEISPYSDFLTLKDILTQLKVAEKRCGVKESTLTMPDAVNYAHKKFGQPKLVDDKGMYYYATELAQID